MSATQSTGVQTSSSLVCDNIRSLCQNVNQLNFFCIAWFSQGRKQCIDLNSSTSSFFCRRPERVSRPDLSVALTLRSLALDKVISENLDDPVLRVIQIWHVLEELLIL